MSGKLSRLPVSAERQALLNNLLPPKTDATQTREELWLPAADIEDNPFQTREEIDSQDPSMLRFMRNLDANGQMQAAGVRRHPDGPFADGRPRWQNIWGHRRKYAVRFGANAFGLVSADGSPKPDAAKYRGLVRAVVIEEPLDDLQMSVLCISENIERDEVSIQAQARSFLNNFEIVRKRSGKNKGDAWAEVAALSGLSYQHMTRMAYVFELPPEWRSKFSARGGAPDENRDEFALNGTHLRALYVLRDWPGEQKTFWGQINSQKWSGNAALKKAEDWARKLKNQQPTLQHQAQARDLLEAKKTLAERAAERNRENLAAGTSHLRAVGQSESAAPPQGAPPVPGLPVAPDAPAVEETPEIEAASSDQTSLDDSAIFEGGLPRDRRDLSRSFRNLKQQLKVADPHLNYVCEVICGDWAKDLSAIERAELLEKMEAIGRKMVDAMRLLKDEK